MGLSAKFIANLLGLTKSDDDGEWDGPPQTPEEIKAGSRWMVDHLTTYYTTSAELRKAYPDEANKAFAIRQYRLLEEMKNKKEITEETYNRELDKILPLISITDLHEK